MSVYGMESAVFLRDAFINLKKQSLLAKKVMVIKDVVLNGELDMEIQNFASMGYRNLGYSHHAVQDQLIRRTLPDLHVFALGNPGETKECVQWLAQHPCPSYLRVSKAGEPALHGVRGVV